MQWQTDSSLTSYTSLDTSPGEVLLLINQVINALGEAKAAVTSLEIEKRFNATMKAIALMDAVEEEMKADISENIRNAFSQTSLGVIANITRTNVKNDLNAAREALTQMISYRQTWTTLYPTAEEECFSLPHSATENQKRSGLYLA